MSQLGASTIAATAVFCSGNNYLEWDLVYNEFNFNFWDGETGSCGGFR